eukprot:CAMPEP_0115135430 /NCGR_PEP_ID=MMETSP0227-20121206/55719_1 /TAXON_ID=89957 /ORGANISM="Polarella glacialis, Strain CCMP 1383" /LENGTH=679 /DNA_ID=CAMNT_0002542163 /DNA_START=63 /DNA_END=2102 /DNA_ORIENTATION=+
MKLVVKLVGLIPSASLFLAALVHADYWDDQCHACPAKLYPSSHCARGGELVAERSCGPAKAHCEGQCRLPRSSPAPQPGLYWDGECKPCPAKLYSHCSKGGERIGERGCGWANLFCEAQCRLPSPAPEAADWVIVGAGASGCAAAAALADAGEDVLVLERGQSDLDIPETQQASTWPAVVNTKAAQEIQWTDGVWGAVANVLGGGTAVNGGLFIEEEPEFLKQSFGDDFNLEDFYASSQWLSQNLTTPLQPSTYGKEYAAALADAGLGGQHPEPQLRMSSNGSWVAYSTINTSAAGKPRRGAAILLHERAHLKNLRFFTQYQVTKVVFEGQRAVSVSIRTQGGDEHVVSARKGVILAAGAIFTPQLLQVSGIGDQTLLGRLGVNAVVKNSAVGQNFIDRNVLTLGAWSSKAMPLFIGYAMAANTSLGLTIECEGWGKVASEFVVASLALVPPDQRTKALRTTMAILVKTGLLDIIDDMIQLVALQQNTHSRGHIEAVSTDPKDTPKVTANYFADDRDLRQQMVALETLLSILKTDPVQEYVKPKTFLPGSGLPEFLSCFSETPRSETTSIVLPCLPVSGSSTERYYEYFRNTAVSSYHYFGTAAFGSVVEGIDFKVKGTDNLHVIDASVFPEPTRVNPQGTIMSLGHYVGKQLATKTVTTQPLRRLQNEPFGDSAPVVV